MNTTEHNCEFLVEAVDSRLDAFVQARHALEAVSKLGLTLDKVLMEQVLVWLDSAIHDHKTTTIS